MDTRTMQRCGALYSTMWCQAGYYMEIPHDCKGADVDVLQVNGQHRPHLRKEAIQPASVVFFGRNGLHFLAFVDRTPPSSISVNLVRSFNAERAMGRLRASFRGEGSPVSNLNTSALFTYLLTLCVVLPPFHVLSSSFPAEKKTSPFIDPLQHWLRRIHVLFLLHPPPPFSSKRLHMCFLYL